MNVMQQYTWKTLRLNRQRTIVTIIGVIISTAMITAVPVFLASFVGMQQRSTIADTGNWHVLLHGVATDRVAQVRGDDAVDRVVLQHDLGYAPLPGSKNPNKPYLFVRQFSADGFEQMSIRLQEGRLPQSGNEIVLSETVNRTVEKPYVLGDKLTLALGRRVNGDGEDVEPSQDLLYRTDPETGEWITDPETDEPLLDERLLPGETRTFTIVGFIEQPGLQPSWSAACSAIGLLEDGSTGTVDVYYTARHVTRGLFDDGAALARSVGAQKPVFNETLLRYYGVVGNSNVFSFLIGVSAVIFVIILVASVSMIGNGFAISVSERSRQLGILASVGATRAQRRASVYFEAALIYAAGVPLGILVGIGGMAATLRAIQPLLESFLHTSGGATLDLVVSPLALLAAVLLSAVTLLLSAREPARIASRVQPIEAIRQSGDIRIEARSVRTGSLVRRLFGFEAEIALKNLKRSRRKYRATITSLIVSIVLFLTVSTYADMAKVVTTASELKSVNYDIAVNYNGLSAERVRAINERIKSLDGIQAMTQIDQFEVRMPADGRLTDQAKLANMDNAEPEVLTAWIVRLDDASFETYARAVGVDPAALSGGETSQAIVINATTGVTQIGDSLQRVVGGILTASAGDVLQLRKEEEDGRAKTAPISLAALTDQWPMGVPMVGFSHVVMVVSSADYDRLAAELSIAPDQMNSRTCMTTQDDVRLENELNGLIAEIPRSQVFVDNLSSHARSHQNLWTFLGVFVYGFITLISLICIANIFNTVSTNVALRRKEFAMLRSVGMTPAGFDRMIRFESVFYGLNSLLYGLPTSVAVALILYRLQGPIIEAPFTLPLGSYAFAIGMIFAVVFATMLYASYRFKRENIIEALREENL